MTVIQYNLTLQGSGRTRMSESSSLNFSTRVKGHIYSVLWSIFSVLWSIFQHIRAMTENYSHNFRG